jgi:hypothetical protein
MTTNTVTKNVFGYQPETPLKDDSPGAESSYFSTPCRRQLRAQSDRKWSIFCFIDASSQIISGQKILPLRNSIIDGSPRFRPSCNMSKSINAMYFLPDSPAPSIGNINTRFSLFHQEKKHINDTVQPWNTRNLTDSSRYAQYCSLPPVNPAKF